MAGARTIADSHAKEFRGRRGIACVVMSSIRWIGTCASSGPYAATGLCCFLGTVGKPFGFFVRLCCSLGTVGNCSVFLYAHLLHIQPPGMALVGTLLFCTACGDLLDRVPTTTPDIECKCCNTPNPSECCEAGHDRMLIVKDKWPASTQTFSKPNAFPSTLRTKRSGVQTPHEDLETWATTSETCPACDSSETNFREMQLRGADEGSTVFFRCSSCSHM
jgi:DNA-directed RNA polymerase I subunit RPA12